MICQIFCKSHLLSVYLLSKSLKLFLLCYYGAGLGGLGAVRDEAAIIGRC